MATIDDLAALLGVDSTAEAEALTAALLLGRVADTNGRGPADPLYTETHDLHFAAAAYVEALAVRLSMGQLTTDQIESFTSEGSTFKLAKPSIAGLYALAARLRGMSPLALAAGLGVINVERPDNFHPRSEVWL